MCHGMGSDREIFVNRLNPYADHVCNLLPGGAFLQHQAAAFHYLLGHNSAAAAYAALSMESRKQPITARTISLAQTR